MHGKKETVHYMEWRGSKGFDDNKNHILSSMAPAVEHVLDYFDKITEPNRVIARFYKNPNAPLKFILANYQVPDKKWQVVKPNINKNTNLCVLGYLLGFYDNAKETKIQVTRYTPGTTEVKVAKGGVVMTQYYKPIYIL